MENIFDGIQRPLEAIQTLSQGIFIPRGINTPALDKNKLWPFEPLNFKVYIYIFILLHNLFIISLIIMFLFSFYLFPFHYK